MWDIYLIMSRILCIRLFVPLRIGWWKGQVVYDSITVQPEPAEEETEGLDVDTSLSEATDDNIDMGEESNGEEIEDEMVQDWCLSLVQETPDNRSRDFQ